MESFSAFGAFIQFEVQMPPLVVVEVAQSDESPLTKMARKFSVSSVHLEMQSEASSVHESLAAVLVRASFDFRFRHISFQSFN